MVSKCIKYQKSKLKQRLTIKDKKSFEDWKRPLQQALMIEADTGFNNLQGRKEFFHSFVVRQLLHPPESLSADSVDILNARSKDFVAYPNSPETVRRREVVALRKFIQSLSSQYDERKSLKPISLNLQRVDPLQESKSSKCTSSLSINSSLADVQGIGLKIAERLSSLGLFTVKDLLTYYPRDYVDYSSLRRIIELVVGETATIVATVRRCSSFVSPRNPNLSILELQLQDPTGRLKVTRFLAGRRFSNKAYLRIQEKLYPPGAIVAVCGLVKDGQYGKSFNDPVVEVLENTQAPLKSKTIGQLSPVYSLTEGISADRFRGFLETVLPLLSSWLDPIPGEVVKSLSLPSKSEALRDIHRPQNRDSLKKARRRLVFDEFFIFQLSLLYRRNRLREYSSPPLITSVNHNSLVALFLESLPFKLTSAQKRVLAEIESDLKSSEPMSRLVQGDVGSGKTVVAIAALLNAVQAGWQGALMAPTEVLAEQHYKNLCKWLPPLHVTVDLLTGSTSRAKRRRILDDLVNGSLKILVGTHALLEQPVTFSRLGLVVVDEQHRFGVRQRNLLLNKGLQPHLLTMTATPIPRTLALSLHGDLDVSQIDELPPGRTPINTNLYSRKQIHKAYELIRQEVKKGQQAYVVLPLVDESEKLDLRSAIKVHEELSREVFSEFSVGLLHGRMNSIDKQRVIEKFLSRQFHILVATTVVEVGVDVPNATVMVIDNADRFGLAQLHQLRGRVGRGSYQSYCILIYDSSHKISKQRLEVLAGSNDGFEISEIDLRLRGPGQVLGTRQSGLPDFALASLIDDADVLELARNNAIEILKQDPYLKSHEKLSLLIDSHWKSFSEKAHLN
tara:strand:+ start:8169 stop:10706 length:2538 start_codon:yes stop_codon:yes gene_type:complete